MKWDLVSRSEVQIVMLYNGRIYLTWSSLGSYYFNLKLSCCITYITGIRPLTKEKIVLVDLLVTLKCLRIQ